MPSDRPNKILTHFKGLSAHLEADEEPLYNIPAIWDLSHDQRSKPCEVILTNQRLLGYDYVKFPRERLFLEAFTLKQINTVSLRQKSYEPLFRELSISEGTRKVYIRAPRKRIEELYAALRSAIEQAGSLKPPVFETGSSSQQVDSLAEPLSQEQAKTNSPIYGKQDIKRPFDRSPLALLILFVGGILLELFALWLWLATQSPSISIPPFLAGLVAVFAAFLTRRRRA